MAESTLKARSSMNAAVAPARNAAYAEFKEALLDFSEEPEPTPVNLERYLNASRALEATTPAQGSPRKPPSLRLSRTR
jgi:hypothetical protein